MRREGIEVITPAIERMQAEGIASIFGPIPADHGTLSTLQVEASPITAA